MPLDDKRDEASKIAARLEKRIRSDTTIEQLSNHEKLDRDAAQMLRELSSPSHGAAPCAVQRQTEEVVARHADALRSTGGQPVPMILYCPRCFTQHVDAPKGDWTNPPHATHTCQGCGLLWRPSNANTTGVQDIEAQEERHRERIVAAHPGTFGAVRSSTRDMNGGIAAELRETLEQMEVTGYGAMHGDLMRRAALLIENFEKWQADQSMSVLVPVDEYDRLKAASSATRRTEEQEAAGPLLTDEANFCSHCGDRAERILHGCSYMKCPLLVSPVDGGTAS